MTKNSFVAEVTFKHLSHINAPHPTRGRGVGVNGDTHPSRGAFVGILSVSLKMTRNNMQFDNSLYSILLLIYRKHSINIFPLMFQL